MGGLGGLWCPCRRERLCRLCLRRCSRPLLRFRFAPRVALSDRSAVLLSLSSELSACMSFHRSDLNVGGSLGDFGSADGDLGSADGDLGGTDGDPAGNLGVIS